MPDLRALAVGDDSGAWARLGFSLDAHGAFGLGGVTVRTGPGERGIAGWSVPGEVDGLPSVSEEPLAEEGEGEHPNGAERIDHVVVVTSSLERTIAALEAAGFELRRVREAGEGRQAFFWAGQVILEVVERGEAGDAARFWGLVVVVADLDATARVLGDLMGAVRAAAQPGRRIATVRRTAGISVPLAFITPHVR